MVITPGTGFTTCYIFFFITDFNLNLPTGRSLSVYCNLNDKENYTDIITLSGVIYSNYNNILCDENNIYKNAYTISNVVYSNKCLAGQAYIKYKTYSAKN